MQTSIQPNGHRIDEVTVGANPQMPDLLTLGITEGSNDDLYETATVRLVLTADVWQRVADALAAAGVVAAPAEVSA